ncbi:hypothetical protein D3C80_1254590 [compost metagenome]
MNAVPSPDKVAQGIAPIFIEPEHKSLFTHTLTFGHLGTNALKALSGFDKLQTVVCCHSVEEIRTQRGIHDNAAQRQTIHRLPGLNNVLQQKRCCLAGMEQQIPALTIFNGQAKLILLRIKPKHDVSLNCPGQLIGWKEDLQLMRIWGPCKRDGIRIADLCLMNFCIPQCGKGTSNDFPARPKQRSEHYTHGRAHDLNTFSGKRRILHIFYISLVNFSTYHDQFTCCNSFLSR